MYIRVYKFIHSVYIFLSFSLYVYIYMSRGPVPPNPAKGEGVVMVMFPPPPCGCGVDSGEAHRIYCRRAPSMWGSPPLWVWVWRCTWHEACIYPFMPCMHTKMHACHARICLHACIRNACICRCGYENAYIHANRCMHAYACMACRFHSLGEPILGDPPPLGGGGAVNPGPQDIYIYIFTIFIYIYIFI